LFSQWIIILYLFISYIANDQFLCAVRIFQEGLSWFCSQNPQPCWGFWIAWVVISTRMLLLFIIICLSSLTKYLTKYYFVILASLEEISGSPTRSNATEKTEAGCRFFRGSFFF